MMKALVLRDYKQLSLDEVPVPEYGRNDLLIRVKACAICGSDIHGMDGSTGRRIPPIIMGHEASGVVEKVGSDVADFKPGDRVTFDSTVYCGRCFHCSHGEVNLCDNRRVWAYHVRITGCMEPLRICCCTAAHCLSYSG